MKAKKHNLLKVILPCMLVLSLLIAGAAFLLTYEPYNIRSITRDPDAQLIKSLKKTKDALESGMAFKIPDAFSQAMNTGAIDLKYNPTEDTTIQNTLYLRDGSITATGTVKTAEGDPFTYGMWFDQENLILNMPPLYDQGAAGIHLPSAKENLKDAALLDYFGITYEDAVDILDMILEMKPGDNTSSGKDWRSMLQMKQNIQALLDSCAVSVQKGNINTDIGAVGAYRVSYSMTPAQLCDALDIFFNWFVTTEVYQTLTKETEYSKETLFAELQEYKKQIVDANANLMANFYLHQKTQVIIQTELRMDWMQDNQAATLQAVAKLGANPIESLHYTAEFSLALPGEAKETVLIDYERSHAHNLPGRKLTISADKDTYTVMELQVNAVTNAFDLRLFNDSLKLSGVCKSDAQTVTMNLQFDGNVSMEFIFRAKAEAPGAPAYKDICTMTQDELANMFPLQTEVGPVDVLIVSGDGSEELILVTQNYDNLGDLLIGEEIAILNEDGSIHNVIGYENVQDWLITSDDVNIESDLYNISLYGGETIYILARAEK